MHHAPIDLGGRESQICIRQPDGAIVEERKLPTRKLTELVATWPTSRVVMEASAAAFKIADASLVVGTRSGWFRGRWCGCLASASAGSRTTSGMPAS
jgi:hypothetical protein